MKNLLNFVALAIALFELTNAQVVFSGQCDSGVKVEPDFNVEAYLGKWYEYSKYPVNFEKNDACITAQYYLQADGSVAVKNTLTDETTGKAVEVLGTGSVVANAKLLVKFPVIPALNLSSNYWVLGTDYSEYSVVYSCQQSSDTEHSTFVWILTRERLPESNVVERALSVLKANSISLDPLTLTNQLACT